MLGVNSKGDCVVISSLNCCVLEWKTNVLDLRNIPLIDKCLVLTFLLWDHWPNDCIYLLYCHSNLLMPRKLFYQPFHLLMQSHFYKIPCQNPPRNHGLWYVGLLGLGLQNHRQYGCKAFYQCVQAGIFHFLACKRPSLWNLKEMINWGIHFRANISHSQFGHYFYSNLYGRAPRGPRGVKKSEFFFYN